jgi:ribosomal protein S18 acetylase RimI-like enzyme
MTDSLQAETALDDELGAAFLLLYQHRPDNERERSVLNALRLIDEGQMRLENVLVVRDGERVCGAMTLARNAGAAGQVWPPQVRDGYPRAPIEDALVAAAVGRLCAGGVRVIQALFDDDDLPFADGLLRGGFRAVSQLCILARSLRQVGDLPHAALHFEPLDEAGAELFQQTLARTYQDTLDFPELNGVRSVSEIMAGHRRQGVYHPDLWFLVREGDEPVGALLLMEMSDWDEWELSYVGVVPEARGRGIGETLVGEAIRCAATQGARQLTVAVDARNTPALSLYDKMGFKELETHHVHLLFPHWWRSCRNE